MASQSKGGKNLFARGGVVGGEWSNSKQQGGYNNNNNNNNSNNNNNHNNAKLMYTGIRGVPHSKYLLHERPTNLPHFDAAIPLLF